MCAFKLFFGIDCPGCGLIRSILALFAGHFSESVAIHPMGVVVVLWLANFWWWRRVPFSVQARKWIGYAILAGFFVPWIIKGGDMFQNAKQVFEEKISVKLKSDPDKAKAIGAKVVFHITGGGDWTLDCSKEPAEVKEGNSEGAAVELTMAEEDFVKLANGQLNPQMAFLGGKLKVKGNMGLALKLGQILT